MTVCLTMIVKNEAHVLARCLRSVLPFIDCYVIADTGSTDTTKDVIRTVLRDVRGEILDRPWVDFATNRNQVIEASRDVSDYQLVIDADDELRGILTDLTHDYYVLPVHEVDGICYDRIHLFRSDLPFRYVGVLHEYLEPTGVGARMPSLKYLRHHDGARSIDPEKYQKDAATLRAALEADPANARYAFYLAQSLRWARLFEEAIAAYEGHFSHPFATPDEQATSLLYIATLKQALYYASNEIEDAYARAWTFAPHRVEPMYELGKHLHARGEHAQAFRLLRPLIGTPIPSGSTPVDVPAYKWGVKDLVAVSAFYVGEFALAQQLNEEMLHDSMAHLPSEEIDRIDANRRLSILAQQRKAPSP